MTCPKSSLILTILIVAALGVPLISSAQSPLGAHKRTFHTAIKRASRDATDVPVEPTDVIIEGSSYRLSHAGQTVEGTITNTDTAIVLHETASGADHICSYKDGHLLYESQDLEEQFAGDLNGTWYLMQDNAEVHDAQFVFKKDNTWTFKGNQAQSGGTYQIEGFHIILTYTSIDGDPVSGLGKKTLRLLGEGENLKLDSYIYHHTH